ncbi:MAG: TRAP transporter large permease [Rhodospirillaceae bacterium]|nr:TRAP transporter large permease [Rhodospirillaceae bacterium]
MTDVGAALAGFSALFALLALRIPVGVAMLGVGVAGYGLLRGWSPLLAYLKTTVFAQVSGYSLAVVPLFLLMGEFAARGGLSRALFRAAYVWMGHRPGGVAMASIGASAGFGAICGSSLATAATMARVALPEMRRYGYSDALATGTLAAGGTLGILIPPSIILVLYALLAEQNIARMFIAALVPGLLAAAGYVAAIAVYVRLRPRAGPPGPREDWSARLAALGDTWPVAATFLLVVGGIYLGWFTPTEGASIGAFATGLAAVTQGGMGWRGLMDCLKGTAGATGMVFLILIGAGVFNAFLAFTGLPQQAAAAIAGSAASPWLVLAAILAGYLVLGCVMDSLSMILLTVPIFLPIVGGLDFGLSAEETLIWFGILALVVVEVGLITPPVGLNVFVINGLADGVPLGRTFRGVLPFLAADMIRIGVLTAFPAISLVLVRWLG